MLGSVLPVIRYQLLLNLSVPVSGQEILDRSQSSVLATQAAERETGKERLETSQHFVYKYFSASHHYI